MPDPFPSLSSTLEPLDTRLGVETPEGIDLMLRPAGVVPRALAFTLDLAIRGLLLGALFFLLALLGQFGLGLMTVLVFLVNWWYMVLFEVLNQGRSPGKQLMGLQVLHDDGTPVGWPASLTRNLLRAVDLLPFGYAFGLLSCLYHPAFKRLGDLAAGTLVIYRERPAAPQSLPDAAPRAPAVPLTLDEQRALVGFAERREHLSAERRDELARIVAEPLRLPAGQPEAQLLGVARSLLGPA